MNTGIATFRKRWPALAAIAVLVAIALTAGTLFAANEWQQPEAPPLTQQPVTDAADPGRAADLPAAPPDPERVPAQQGDHDEDDDDLPPIIKVPPTYPNLDSNLNRLAERAQAADSQPETADDSGSGGNTGSVDGSAPPMQPVLVTFYVEPEHVAAVRQYLEDNDVYIRNVGEDWIEAHVPPALLPAASELPGVRRVDTVIPPEPAQSQGGTISQGVALHQADKWHDMGYLGKGVKVGIIDSGYEGFSQRQGSELPRNVMARCYSDRDNPRPVSSSLADCEVGSIHGTAVAETVIDVAPEVQLYIAQPQSAGDLRDAVDWMVDNGVHVVNRSVGGLYEGPGDGTSWFSISRLNSIDAAVSGGIIFVQAAGNQAKRGWFGGFADPDGDNILHFTSRDTGNTFYLPFVEDSRSASRVSARMRWDDSWGGADCDLDLLLIKSVPGPNTLVDHDDEVQAGGVHDIPVARVRFEAESADDEGQYYLRIDKHTCPDEPAWIQIIAFLADELQYYSRGYTLTPEADSRNPGILVVGAAHWESPGFVAPYSSRGPTVDGRIKPDITGISCGRSTVYPRRIRSDDSTECWFSGTSQAAPHVAGLAALVRQRFPHYAPWQVAQYLKNNAVDRGSWGADSTWGHGLARLPTRRDDPPPLRGSQPITDLRVTFPSENSDDEADISWVPVPEATHYRIGYVNMAVDYHLATRASCTMDEDDWLQAFVYVDVKAPNVPVRNGRAEYTIRRLSEGDHHAFTVLASNNLYNNITNVGADFSWPTNPRWQFRGERRNLPPGVTIPPLDCPQ